ncbi:lipopolysaccharide biosynthesis protein [Parafannyhessea sp. LCP21S3_E6]|uniref:lipopolysaccharide biosynthesis protein n=1 Tax=unclassified Parafannyhessea TaxID=2847323 RepID=UPI003F9B8E5E
MDTDYTMKMLLNEMWNRYRSLSKVKRATLWITLSGFILRGISFITVPIFTRLLTTSEYGSFSVYQSWESVFVYMVTLGVAYGGFNNGMVRYPEDKEGYTSSVTGLIIIMGAVWFVLASVFQDQASALTGMPNSYVLLMLVDVVASEIYDIWACRARYDFDYRKVVVAAIILAAGVPALGIPFVILAQDKVLARILSFVLVEVAMAIVLGNGMMRRGRKFFCADYWKFTLAFNIPLLPHYLSQVMLGSSDRIMIRQMCSTADAGVYSIAYSAGMIMTVLTSSLNNTVMPWLYRRLEAKEYGGVGKVALEILGTLAVLILLMDALAPEIVAILAPSKYGEALGLVPVIAASVFFIFLYSFCSNIEFFWEKTRVATVASVIAAILNVALNAIFIPLIGYRAAGYTTLACYVVLGVAHYTFAQQVAKQRTGASLIDGRAVWGMAAVLVVASVAFAGLYPYPLVRYALLAVAAIICASRRKIIAEKIRGIRS